MITLKKAGKTWDDVVESRAKFDDIDTLAIVAFKKGATTSKRLPFISEEDNIEQTKNIKMYAKFPWLQQHRT